MFDFAGVQPGGSGLLDDLTRAVEEVQGYDSRGVPLASLVSDIAVLHTQVQRLQAVLLDMVRVCDADGGHHLAGYATTGAMLTDGLRLNPGGGQGLTRTARALHTRFTATADALAAGEISTGHATAITAAARKLPGEVLADAEPELLNIARAGSPADVRAGIAVIAELLEPEQYDTDDQKQRTRRRLDVSATSGGWWAVDGYLPPEAGQRLAAALADYAAAAGPGDPRTATQRRADAIADIADAAVAGSPTGAAAVTIVADADHLDGAGATWDATGLPVGRSSFDLAVCQSQLRLVVAERAGIGWKPLAVGMLSRYATGAQRAALHVRDRRCVFRGCTRPARRCHAHHILDWRHGGPTDLDNLVLLCAYHHRMVHLGRAILIPDPDTPGRHIAEPARRHTPAAA